MQEEEVFRWLIVEMAGYNLHSERQYILNTGKGFSVLHVGFLEASS